MRRITTLTETGLRDVPDMARFKPVDDFFLVDESQDLRGRPVSGRAGHLGEVRDMLVDPDSRRVAALELSNGRRVAIENVRLDGRELRLTE